MLRRCAAPDRLPVSATPLPVRVWRAPRGPILGLVPPVAAFTAPVICHPSIKHRSPAPATCRRTFFLFHPPTALVDPCPCRPHRFLRIDFQLDALPPFVSPENAALSSHPGGEAPRVIHDSHLSVSLQSRGHPPVAVCEVSLAMSILQKSPWILLRGCLDCLPFAKPFR